MKKEICNCCGADTKEAGIERKWGFSEFTTCPNCLDHGCFPMKIIFIDVSHGLKLEGRFHSRHGARTPIIMENGCVVMKGGEYVLIKDVFDAFGNEIAEIAGINGWRRDMMDDFCEKNGFYNVRWKQEIQ